MQCLDWILNQGEKEGIAPEENTEILTKSERGLDVWLGSTHVQCLSLVTCLCQRYPCCGRSMLKYSGVKDKNVCN